MLYITLTYFIHTSQVKNLSTSMLAFDIAQFFPLLNHQLLLILIKAGFDLKILFFFQDYLVGRQTKYLWNNSSFPSFNVDIGVGQWFALSPILSALYLSLLLYIFEKQLKNLKFLVSILSFIDNGLFIAQNKSLMISNLNLFYSYYIIISLLEKFRLIIEYRKMEIFHFSRSYSTFDPLPLDLMLLGDPIL